MKSGKSFYYIILTVLIIMMALLIHLIFAIDKLQERISTLEQKIENSESRIIPAR